MCIIEREKKNNSERFEPRWVNVVVWVIADDGFRSGCRNVSQHQQQSFSGLHYKPGRSLKPQQRKKMEEISKFPGFLFGLSGKKSEKKKNNELNFKY